MVFDKCIRISDGLLLSLEDKLAINTYKNVFNDNNSIYQLNQQIIPDSAFFKGIPNYQLNVPIISDLCPHRIENKLLNGLYFWLGPIHPHFGHFLISTLSRIWALKYVPTNVKIAYIGDPLDKIFSTPYMAYIFEKLRIQRHRFVRITQPTMFGKLIIAEKSFNENHSISELYKEVFDKVIPPAKKTFNTDEDEYIYVSKSKVLSGVRTIENEQDLCDYLTTKGIKCVYPEQLTFEKQLEFWRDHKNFVGYINAAFHLSTFFGPKNLILINRSIGVSENYALCDYAAKNKTVHIHTNDIKKQARTNNFTEVLKIEDIEKFGNSLINVIKNVKEKRITPQKLPIYLKSVSKKSFYREPLGENISNLGIKISQSSLYDVNEGLNRTSEGLVSGKLTGKYQCHTKHETNPWWQIEFNDTYLFTEVRLFNRLDSEVVKKRSNLLSILVSSDGINFTEVHKKQDKNVPFGGADGFPYRWQPNSNVRGKIIRIQLDGVNFLHLDQVEIFGEKSDWFGTQV